MEAGGRDGTAQRAERNTERAVLHHYCKTVPLMHHTHPPPPSPPTHTHTQPDQLFTQYFPFILESQHLAARNKTRALIAFASHSASWSGGTIRQAPPTHNSYQITTRRQWLFLPRRRDMETLLAGGLPRNCYSVPCRVECFFFCFF